MWLRTTVPGVQVPQGVPFHRDVIQWSEGTVWGGEAAGSSPVIPTTLSECISAWLESPVWSGEVGGSNPSTQTKIHGRLVQW